ncbi:2-C-methyl-D-erythritol 4-phosphate cytidylyltransferase [Actinomadura keratinilytica]
MRLGPGTPKALRTLHGTPMLVHAVRAMAASRAVSLVVVVAPPDGVAEVRAMVDDHLHPTEAPSFAPARAGGGDETDIVVVAAARPGRSRYGAGSTRCPPT